MKTVALILAAGKGERMRSPLHKVLHSLCGRPMIDYVLDAVAPLSNQKPLVAVSFEKEQKETLEGLKSLKGIEDSAAKPEKSVEPEKPLEPVHVEFEGEPTPAEMHASDPVEEMEAEQPTEE